MNTQKTGLVALVLVLLVIYNSAQPHLYAWRTSTDLIQGTHKPQRYGPSMAWLDRLMNARADKTRVKLDFSVLSSLMVAGLASGFKSQVANMLWMKSDEYWHQGLNTRQIPLMEAVVTLDPQFIDAWSTAGWHWAYNIFADIELDPKLKGQRKEIRLRQENAVMTGLDYLKRGAEMNPDTYRLWFEHGWTRYDKAGMLDEETVRLFSIARQKPDVARMERTKRLPNGEVEIETVPGLDYVGRAIGHVYEKMPLIDKALDQYASLLKATPQERQWLARNGEYWHKYGDWYFVIGEVYKGGDAVQRAEIKRLVPDVETLVKAYEMRMALASRPDGTQPVGAYVSIVARYGRAWELYKAGKLAEARMNIIGVMNVDPRYHLMQRPVLNKILEMRGDSPEAIAAAEKRARDYEKESSQEIGLHLLANIYLTAASRAGNEEARKALLWYAYETWYRARERDQLNFYARRKAWELELQNNFDPPQQVINQVKKSRRGGTVLAMPAMPANPSMPTTIPASARAKAT